MLSVYALTYKMIRESDVINMIYYMIRRKR